MAWAVSLCWGNDRHVVKARRNQHWQFHHESWRNKRVGGIGQAYDCPPTLTDQQVLDFCYQGYLKLEAVVPDEVNRRTTEFLERMPAGEPNEILREDWFDEHVIKNK